jgi:hypothetical protein
MEAISKGPPLNIKIDGSSSYAGNVFWPNPPNAGSSLSVLRFLSASGGLNQNPIFEMASRIVCSADLIKES